jgi:hypothetical protein
MKDVDPNRCGEPVSPLKEPSPFRAGRRSVIEINFNNYGKIIV